MAAFILQCNYSPFIMTPSLYEIISQGGSLMNIIAAKMQQEKDNPENVKRYAGELKRTVSTLLKVNTNEFSVEGRQRFKGILSEINNVASQLADGCDAPETVMHLTGGELKSLLTQFGDLLKSERPEIRGKGFWESIKERFKK